MIDGGETVWTTCLALLGHVTLAVMTETQWRAVNTALVAMMTPVQGGASSTSMATVAGSRPLSGTPLTTSSSST
jgi:hypothetical protein